MVTLGPSDSALVGDKLGILEGSVGIVVAAVMVGSGVNITRTCSRSSRRGY